MAKDLSLALIIKANIDDFLRGNKRVQKGIEDTAKVSVSSQKKINDAFGTLGIKPFKEINREVKKAEKAFLTLKNSGKLSAGELAKAQLALRDRLRESNDAMNGFGRRLKSIQGEIIGFVASFAALGSVGRSIIKTGVNIDALRASLRAAVGSAEDAGKSYRFVRQEADRLGLSFEDLLTGYTGLAAAAKGTAIQGDELKNVFSALAEASTVFQLSSDQMRGALLAVQQMLSKGTVSAEELRGQLGERLFGAFQIAARSIGSSTEELGKALQSGLVQASDFLPQFARQIRLELGESVPEASASARAAFNRLGNAMLDLKLAIADSGLLDLIKALAQILTVLLQIIGQLPAPFKIFLAAMTSGVALFATWKLGLGAIVGALGDLVIGLKAAAASSVVLNIAMRAIPVVALVAGIVSLVQWFTRYDKSLKKTAKSTKDNSNEIKLLEGKVKNLLKKRADLEKQLTEELKKEENKRLNISIAAHKDVVLNLESDLQKSLDLQQQYTDKLRQLRNGITDEETRAQEKIREIRRQSLTEAERQADIELQTSDLLRQAQDETLAGNEKEAQALARKAEQVAGQLTDQKKLITVVQQSSQIIIQAKQQEIEKTQDAIAAEKEQEQAIRGRIEAQLEQIAKLSATLKNLEKPVKIEIQSNMDQISKQAEDLQKQIAALSNAAVTSVKALTGDQTRIVRRRLGGAIPGFGGGDIVPALLEPGEFIIRKEAVQRFGAGLLNSINSLQMPKNRFADGGPVAAAGASISIGNITLPGVTNAQELIAELEQISRTDPLNISTTELGIIQG